jgi:hypothetical protein
MACGGLFEPAIVAAPVKQRDIRPALRQPQRDTLADTAASPGHERDPARQVE